MSSLPLAGFDSNGFTALLRSRFQVSTGPPGGVELELVEVTPARKFKSGAAGASEYESFSLIFEGPGALPLPQGTHSFAHAQTGVFDLFIVPIGRKDQKIQYQAVFNRSVKAA
jgi:hypothetical protein